MASAPASVAPGPRAIAATAAARRRRRRRGAPAPPPARDRARRGLPRLTRAPGRPPAAVTSADGTELLRRGVRPRRRRHRRPRPRLDRAAGLLGAGDQAPARRTACASSPMTCAATAAAARPPTATTRWSASARTSRRCWPRPAPAPTRAGHRGRPLAGRDVDRRLGRAPRSVARARARAALLNTGLGDLIAGHLLLPQLARLLNHPRASRARAGLHGPLPPFSTPLQQAMIRYIAFGPTRAAATSRSTSGC